MEISQPLLLTLDIIMQETAFFAASGFLLLGLGDLAVDGTYLGLLLFRKSPRPSLELLCMGETKGKLAIFVPAWDEAAVIGRMLRNAINSFEHLDYRPYVGCYPNDQATISEVEAIADHRVRLVVGEMPGPTTKAQCLNSLWVRLLEDEREEGFRHLGVILHDAEDVVHKHELRIFAELLNDFDLVQLPVEPIIHPASRWISGHYADEFAEAHAKELVVRQRLGAALPAAGVGCAFSRGALESLASVGGGFPFDADSLTEDYELGLKLRGLGGTQTFVRIAPAQGQRPIASRGYFPASLAAAVNQKSRWMAGIALLGWDRLGWCGGFAERWARLPDRQSLLAALLLFCGYASFALWSILKLPETIVGWEMRPFPFALSLVLQINTALLLWRMLMRFASVTQTYGITQGFLSIPRMVVGNYITMRAGWRALFRYREVRRGARPSWDKTAHSFAALIAR